jgi:hypothetical protein
MQEKFLATAGVVRDNAVTGQVKSARQGRVRISLTYNAPKFSKEEGRFQNAPSPISSARLTVRVPPPIVPEVDDAPPSVDRCVVEDLLTARW